MNINKQKLKNFLKTTSIWDWIMDSFWRVLAVSTLMVCGLILLGSLIESSIPTISIKKSEWKCTEKHKEVRYGSQFNGKTASTYSYYITVCDNYQRIKQ